MKQMFLDKYKYKNKEVVSTKDKKYISLMTFGKCINTAISLNTLLGDLPENEIISVKNQYYRTTFLINTDYARRYIRKLLHDDRKRNKDEYANVVYNFLISGNINNIKDYTKLFRNDK